MKHYITINVFLLLLLGYNSLQGQDTRQGTLLVVETSMGDMEVLLYDDTPLHRDNMLKLVGEGFYNNLIFHRVIENFMVQGGDPYSRNAPKGQRLGTGGPGYTVPAEIRDHHFHKKGALAAARKGDNVNPSQKSSGSQFYIVHGQVFNTGQLSMMQSSGHHSPFTPEQIEAYTTIGGAPHLDGAYTVFGEVVKGLDVLDKIASAETDNYDRPVDDIVFSIHIK